MKMTVPWLRSWLAFFRRNEDYRAYCMARREGDTATCRSIEAKFERVAELYTDWGDIHTPEQANPGIEGYWAWAEGRDKSLFFRARVVTRIDDPASYVKRTGHLLLDVPLSEKLSEVIEQVERYLALVYKMQTDVLERDEPVSKAVMELPTPKYMLHAPSGTLNAATRGAIEKAIYVDRLRQQVGPNGKPLSLTDKVLAIKQDPKNPFGWSLTEQDKRDIAKGVYKKGLFGGSEVTLVKRAQKDFDAYVRNTIYGRFPDNS